MSFISNEEKQELEGVLYTKRFPIIFGLIILYFVMNWVGNVIGGIVAVIFNLIGLLVIIIGVGFVFYNFNFRKSPRKQKSDGLEIRLQGPDDPKFDNIQDWLINSNLARTDLEPYIRIFINLSNKYQKKFELKSALAVTSSKDAYNDLVRNGIIDKNDKDIRKNKIEYFRKGMAMQKEVMDKSQRGNIGKGIFG